MPATGGHSRTSALRKVVVKKEPSGAEVELCFYTAEQGGRSTPFLIESGLYRPHFVPTGGEYLGVIVTRGSTEPVSPGVAVGVEVSFPYDVSYGTLSEGSAFRVMEGGRAVGEGRVLRLF